jgi:hypothetical protein
MMMAWHPIDCIVESLVTGDLGVDDFMRAVQKNIEELEMRPIPYEPTHVDLADEPHSGRG